MARLSFIFICFLTLSSIGFSTKSIESEKFIEAKRDPFKPFNQISFFNTNKTNEIDKNQFIEKEVLLSKYQLKELKYMGSISTSSNQFALFKVNKKDRSKIYKIKLSDFFSAEKFQVILIDSKKIIIAKWLEKNGKFQRKYITLKS